MTLLDEIKQRLSDLPPEKQSEALDFIVFLAGRAGVSEPAKRRLLKKHAAFGSWKHRKIDAVQYQQNLRADWGK